MSQRDDFTEGEATAAERVGACIRRCVVTGLGRATTPV
jgi:hypothetical protein